MVGYAITCLLLFPLNIFSMNLKTICDQLKLPRECQCQFNRQLTIDSVNETRLRCRQLTEIKTDYDWSKIPYDRLIFETLNENLTLHPFVFADIVVRTLRFYVPNLLLQDHTFDHAHIGQLAISDARIDFQSHSQIFFGTTITNLHFKSIDFQTPISEWIFSNAKIYIFLVESSKFYGFSNQNRQTTFKNPLKMKYDYFLEYESFLPSNRTTFHPIDESSSTESEQTVIMNITSENYPIYLTIYTIISSINTTNLTENYFPNNLAYHQLEEIELSFNEIHSLDADVFRHLRQFQGRLILQNNQIDYLDLSAFDHLYHLKNLSLAKNFLQNLSPRHFQDLIQLNELDLSFNQFYQLENNTFEYLINLERLYLNYNPLEFIHPDTFSSLIKLKEIHLQGVHLINQQDFQWIWNLASLHVNYSLKTDFELSDVAFCMLSRYNQTLFHFSREHSCSCHIHYFNLNQNSTENSSKYQTNYLRLTPVCHDNETETIFQEQAIENDLILQGLENQCDYRLMFLDCDAMTTTTIETTTLSDNEIEKFDAFVQLTTETVVLSTTSRSVLGIFTKKKSLNNIKKLFTVLATLIAITIFAIVLVFFWYRFKTTIKQGKKKQSSVEQERHFNSPAFNDHQSTTVRYASSDMSGSLYSGQVSTTKSQSEALIESSKNTETIENDPVQKFIDEDGVPLNSMTRKSVEM